MEYINKRDVLSAYKVLSAISPAPDLQGATQKVSAIRYFIALDMFCCKKRTNQCSSREKSDKELFENYVGQMCSVQENLYTSNFYYPLKIHNGDYNVVSNFYSAGQVRASLINPTELFDYPKRGNAPLLRIRNGILIKDLKLYPNINSYIETDKAKAALVIWMSRNVAIAPGESAFERLQNTLKQMVSSEMIDLLMPNTRSYHTELEEFFKSSFTTSPSLFTDKDIADLFSVSIMQPRSDNTMVSRQVIYYGAPGTGKSYKIKKYLEDNCVPKENIFRTTFHPDSDYSAFVGTYKPKMKMQYRYSDGGVRIKYYEDDDLVQAKKNDPIVDKIIEYSFVPQVFLNAYVRAYQKTEENVYLVIEEINRGNCAQIFGDLFQLLDRNAEGKSEYTIKADADLKSYLEEKLGEENEGIKYGELSLPANLYIFATMNTSDQSLFPVDSAFKRRWDWEYEPIKYKNQDWKIVVGNKVYSWVSFQEEINKRIFDATHSEDKMLGDYFVNPYDGTVTEQMLLNKVLFYLWNDVCREDEGDIFKTSETEEVTFSELYGTEGQQKLMQMMETLGIELVSDTTNDDKENKDEVDSNQSKDFTKYSINGGSPVAKRMVAAALVKQYISKHSELSATEVVNNWKTLGTFVSHFIETQAEYKKRTDNNPRVEVIECHGEKIYVSTNGWGGQGIMDNLISAIPEEWNLKVEKVN